MPRLLWLSPLLLAACATAPAAEPQPPVAGQSGSVCRNENLSRFAGRPATAEVGSEILRASGARALRWVAPGMMVTMEFREDRVTVWLEPQTNVERVAATWTNRIKRVSCG